MKKPPSGVDEGFRLLKESEARSINPLQRETGPLRFGVLSYDGATSERDLNPRPPHRRLLKRYGGALCRLSYRPAPLCCDTTTSRSGTSIPKLLVIIFDGHTRLEVLAHELDAEQRRAKVASVRYGPVVDVGVSDGLA